MVYEAYCTTGIEQYGDGPLKYAFIKNGGVQDNLVLSTGLIMWIGP